MTMLISVSPQGMRNLLRIEGWPTATAWICDQMPKVANAHRITDIIPIIELLISLDD